MAADPAAETSATKATAAKSPSSGAVGYWAESRRPLSSLAFVAPMLVAYELGVVVLGQQATRNGVDVCLRGLLDLLGFGQYFLLPALTVGILLAWHHTTAQAWRIRARALYGMSLESMALGFVLLVVANAQAALFAPTASIHLSASAAPAGEVAGRLVGYLGAGTYEELLFRLMLLPVVAAIARAAGATPRVSLATAVVLTSLVFSAAHYEIFTTHGDAFQWYSFVFRFVAGVFFSLLFVWRGFGVAVGTHACYDVLAVLS